MEVDTSIQSPYANYMNRPSQNSLPIKSSNEPAQYQRKSQRLYNIETYDEVDDLISDPLPDHEEKHYEEDQVDFDLNFMMEACPRTLYRIRWERW